MLAPRYKPKLKRCKVCGAEFHQRSMAHVVCSPRCAIAHTAKMAAKSEREAKKVERKQIRERKEKLKTRRQWLADAQQAFNAYVRERDKGRPCICCGEPMNWNANQVDAGHYRSVGSAPHLRFDERNVHAQRKQCNRWGAGRAVDYRIGLIARIGVEAVEALEADQTVRKWTIDELRAIRDEYRAKLKELRKANG